MDFQFLCQVPDCGGRESWDVERAAQAAAVWHVYTTHPDYWAIATGSSREPVDPRPETFGSRLVSQ